VFVGEPLSEELTRVQDFTLAVVDAAARLSQGEAGATSISAWLTTLSGVMHSLGERHIYSTDQRTRLTEAIARCYPALHALLDDADRRALSQRMAELSMAETDPALRAAQKILAQKLR
jgi:hypothetical protein